MSESLDTELDISEDLGKLAARRDRDWKLRGQLQTLMEGIF